MDPVDKKSSCCFGLFSCFSSSERSDERQALKESLTPSVERRSDQKSEQTTTPGTTPERKNHVQAQVIDPNDYI